MQELSEQDYYEGVAVDLNFQGSGPKFGDLFMICGYDNPNFPPSGDFPFDQFEKLQFSQVDDYFGVENEDDEGDDVIVWLFPLVDGEVVDHHAGPFDGLRIAYNVLCNPIRKAEHFYLVLETLAEHLPVTMSESLEAVKERVKQINAYWLQEGITPGSDEAMEIDF